MAIRPDYQTGTIDLVASSADFTTTGAALQMVAVQPGDAIITPSGHVLIIASITGQNSGTLFLPCPPDAAGTGLPLRIRFQPDGSRYQGAVRNLIDLLSSGNLEDFAALVGASGMVPIFTGPGTLDLADPATFGIQDPNGSLGKLAALTLAANKILNTDGSGNLTQSDITAAAVALMNLSGTAATDRMPYFTGENGAGLTALTSFARTILDDASGAEMWATMGGAYTSGTNSSYIRLPDAQGTIIQRGVYWTGNGPNITLPIAFPTAIRSVVASIGQRPNAGTPLGVMTGFESQTAFAAYTFNTTTGAAVTATLYWIAIGW